MGRGSQRAGVARSVGVSPSTVVRVTARARRAGLLWPLPPELDEGVLEARLYPPTPSSRQPRAAPDFKSVHRELRRKGVTLQLLWEEYREAYPRDGYGYSRFCDLYRGWAGKLDVVMRQEHRAGEKVFVDFSGDGIPIVNRETGEVTEAALFVAALGASSYTYFEAFPSKNLLW